jgi:hypothetical protein
VAFYGLGCLLLLACEPPAVSPVAAPSPTAVVNVAPVTGTTTPAEPFGVPTKTTGCRANGGLPDPACTPGAVIPDADRAAICRSGYSTSVRDVSVQTKDQVYAAYGVTERTSGEYEVDHLVSLELGGSNDVANLWPEASQPAPGFHQKDAVENFLHAQVCDSREPLLQAQHEIATDWLSVFTRIPTPTRTAR